jgi:hypothetical protein
MFARQSCRSERREIVSCVVFEFEELESIEGFSADYEVAREVLAPPSQGD